MEYDEIGLSFNVTKCEVLLFNWNASQPEIQLGSQVVMPSKSIVYLGLPIGETLQHTRALLVKHIEKKIRNKLHNALMKLDSCRLRLTAVHAGNSQSYHANVISMIFVENLPSCRICNAQGTDCREEGSVAGRGIKDADFVFYVSALNTNRCHKGQTVAYAAHCQQEVSLDRPIAGHANLCPNSISTKPQELDILISTVKHEILHALGFSVSLYAFYRDNEGNPLSPRGENGKPELNHALQARQWSDKVIKKINRPDWLVRSGRVTRQVQMVVTPRVVEEVRKHFGCDDLEGAELEDQGEEGTSLTHWEKRVFEYGELEVIVITILHLISNINAVPGPFIGVLFHSFRTTA
ncbi:hypothetical protein QYM36_009308 [Artemia franciscana]|uniref:Leishmanolysin-like peptidase n=1 Tax=Artemia franciscana TaxID=6661 RepID=A0AA88HK63_ARTSF|nr:hypothetical protein QYM36_009308 [Artemia franciscana]